MSATPKDVEKLIKALKANKFDPVEFVETAEAATRRVLEMIPKDVTVGIPGSTTIRELGLHRILKERGIKVVDILAPGELTAEDINRKSLLTDVLIVSSNAITMDGKLVNTDAFGNRVAAMIFGPKKVIFIIGMNKLVKDVNEALDRIKKVVAPYHSATRGGKTPCTATGECNDCNSSDRICNVTTIIEKRPGMTQMAIILVGEDLGLGWDPAWSQERKDKIGNFYRETRKTAYK